MLSKWSTLQLGILLFMLAVFFTLSQVAERLQQLLHSDILFIPGSIISSLLFFIFLIGCFYLLTFFQEKKTGTFLSHKLWKKMPLILVGVFTLSAIVLMAVFTTVSIPVNFGIEYRWVLDLMLSYFLLLFYLLVVSVLIRFQDEASSETIIHRSFFVTIAAYLFFVFLF
ncbi:hypothetical protein [Jeotgalibacillus marinus]|uniref:Uncharacterized protein n=1 Tax=Jeotgalibacillus marinus TaxID=86667 RepID=A0ABV3Q1A9_9BACL